MREQIGDLNCLVRPGENPGHNVVLLHGFGANAQDLFPLAQVLDPDENWTFYVPDAPLEVPIGPHMTGLGWFPISIRDLEVGVDFTQVRPPGMDKSSSLVGDLIFHLNSKKLVLMGFSQGAMLASEVTLHSPEDVTALVLLSSTLVDEPGWKKRAAGLKGKKILQSHGQRDPVLPIAVAQRLNETLKAAGADVTWVPFGGGHEIPMNVLAKVKTLLESV